MKAFILAAGEGTRMRPLTAYTPKPLLPVGGRPILQHTIDSLSELVEEVVILVGWKGKKIKDTITSDRVDITFAKQEEPLGTAHAISKAEKYVEDRFICLNGDVILLKGALSDFFDYFDQRDRSVIGMSRVERAEGYGVIRTEDEMVKEIIEKPERAASDLVNAGLYGFTEEIFDAIERTEISPRGEYEITDSLQFLMEEKKLLGYELIKDSWIELSRPWELLSANRQMLTAERDEEKRAGHVEDGVHLEGWVHVDDGAKIKRGSYIKGPVFIGEDSQIGPNCLIRPCTSIGKGCKVGNAVEIKNSIIMENSNVPHHNYVGDSVIGKDCNLGSGSKVANLRLDEEKIIVTHRGKNINTGRKKLGVIMGDHVKTGINSMLNTGTIIGEGSFIGPGAVAHGEIGPRSRIQ